MPRFAVEGYRGVPDSCISGGVGVLGGASRVACQELLTDPFYRGGSMRWWRRWDFEGFLGLGVTLR